MSQIEINLTVNGRGVRRSIEPRMHLADFLREELLLTGTHLGCEQGVCGACTVMIDGRPCRSCITLAAACDAADVRTIESFDGDPLMIKLRDAFSAHHGLQCGFCTPGMLATAYDVVRRLPDADSDIVRKELSGNLCRCTGYQGAVNAVAQVIANDPPAATLQPGLRNPSQVNPTAVKTDSELPISTTALANSSALAVPKKITDGVRLERRLTINAPVDDVWNTFREIETVVDCIPGGRATSIDGQVVHGTMVVGLGPMRANLNGIAEVHLDDGEKSGRVIGRGGDRLTRSIVDGEMSFRLLEGGINRSVLELDIHYLLKGPLAQFGRPAIVAEVADRILADTAANIAARATGAAPATHVQKPLAGLPLIWSAFIAMLQSLFRR